MYIRIYIYMYILLIYIYISIYPSPVVAFELEDQTQMEPAGCPAECAERAPGCASKVPATLNATLCWHAVELRRSTRVPGN